MGCKLKVGYTFGHVGAVVDPVDTITQRRSSRENRCSCRRAYGGAAVEVLHQDGPFALSKLVDAWRVGCTIIVPKIYPADVCVGSWQKVSERNKYARARSSTRTVSKKVKEGWQQRRVQRGDHNNDDLIDVVFTVQ